MMAYFAKRLLLGLVTIWFIASATFLACTPCRATPWQATKP